MPPAAALPPPCPHDSPQAPGRAVAPGRGWYGAVLCGGPRGPALILPASSPAPTAALRPLPRSRSQRPPFRSATPPASGACPCSPCPPHPPPPRGPARRPGGRAPTSPTWTSEEVPGASRPPPTLAAAAATSHGVTAVSRHLSLLGSAHCPLRPNRGARGRAGSPRASREWGQEQMELRGDTHGAGMKGWGARTVVRQLAEGRGTPFTELPGHFLHEPPLSRQGGPSPEWDWRFARPV